MALAIIVVVGLHVALPAKYRVNPPWVLPVVLLALLAALIIGDPGRIDRQKTWLRVTNRCQPSRLRAPDDAHAGASRLRSPVTMDTRAGR